MAHTTMCAHSEHFVKCAMLPLGECLNFSVHNLMNHLSLSLSHDHTSIVLSCFNFNQHNLVILNEIHPLPLSSTLSLPLFLYCTLSISQCLLITNNFKSLFPMFHTYNPSIVHYFVGEVVINTFLNYWIMKMVHLNIYCFH